MNKIEIYTKSWCPYCAMAKSLLNSQQLAYDEIDVTINPLLEQEMIQRAGQITVPQIFIDDQSIGGFDDLNRLHASGELTQLLDSSMIEESLE